MRPVPHGLGDGVRIWWADLDLYAGRVRLDGLRPKERARAARMLFSRDAKRFLCGRHLLYALLGEALGRQPAKIALVTDEFGKPALAGAELHFNTSRSGSEALIGLSRAGTIGVDIECVRTIDDADALARAHFTAAESARLCSDGSGAARGARFLEYWTRKEACVKALGRGLSIPLRRVEVGPAAEPRSVDVRLGTESVPLRVCSVYASVRSVAAAALVAPD